MTVIPHARPSVNIVSVLSGNPPPTPFKNVQWQTVPVGTDPDTVDLYLWNTDAEPFVGVDIVMVNPNHYRFAQQGGTVGHVRIDAPAGTDGYTLSTPDGPSTATLAAVSGLPTAKLNTQFSPDLERTGRYRVKFTMNNGNTQRQVNNIVAVD
jgi:hypothetical protein